MYIYIYYTCVLLCRFILHTDRIIINFVVGVITRVWIMAYCRFYYIIYNVLDYKSLVLPGNQNTFGIGSVLISYKAIRWLHFNEYCLNLKTYGE